MIIRNRKRLAVALARLTRYQIRKTALETRIHTIQNAVLAFYKRKHIDTAKDTEGIVWRRMQGSSAVYDDIAFRKLLRKKHIDTKLIYKSRVVIERDDTEIMKLLKENKISVQEWKSVATIRYFAPYLRRQARSNKSRTDDTDTDS